MGMIQQNMSILELRRKDSKIHTQMMQSIDTMMSIPQEEGRGGGGDLPNKGR